VDLRLVDFSSRILRLLMRKVMTIDWNNTRSTQGVIDTQVLDVREFPQPEDDGIERNQE
jgi:hypothetical protein